MVPTYRCRHCGQANPIPPERRPAGSDAGVRKPPTFVWRIMACRHCGLNNRVKVPYAD